MEGGIKLRIKINNSYESEPSSGSGSSLSEHNEGHASDEENINLPFLLKPSSYNNRENNAKSNSNPTPINSDGQDSPFCGFGDSPYGNVNKRLYGSQHAKLKLPEPKEVKKQRTPPGKLVFPKFYDTIIEENSCNAVDLQMAQEKVKDNQLKQALNKGSNYSNDLNISILNKADLSFNGKIKSLIERSESVEHLPTTSANLSISTVLESTNNTTQLTESFILHKYNNEKSPDIFADSDEEEDMENDNVNHTIVEETEREDPKVLAAILTAEEKEQQQCIANESNFVDEQTLDCSTMQGTGDDKDLFFHDNLKRERELLRRIRKSLGGVRPPPSVTIPQLDVITSVINLKSKILSFLSSDGRLDERPSTSSKVDGKITNSLFKPTHTLAEAQAIGWRDVLGVRQHGISYNLSKASEHNEYLSLSVIERFIGAETSSSYMNSPSSAKKRNTRLKLLTQSPGNRLSHLAKRRAIFSSANLATNSLKLNNSIGPQIAIHKKKSKNRRKGTPKRMTPASKKKIRKTPSSSARKRLYRCDLIKPGPSRETSKRALFQSPAKTQLRPQAQPPPKPIFKPEIANRVEKSKRALFSPDNEANRRANNTYTPSNSSSNQLDTLLKRKRNNADDEDSAEFARQSNKLFRVDSSNLTPRALKIKSQSFCIGAGSSNKTTALSANGLVNYTSNADLELSNSQTFGGSNNSLLSSTKLHRAHSDISASQNSLTENQRKKLLWAVSQALQERKITAKHEHFRQYASVLVRAVKRIFQDFFQKNVTSNSETMLRLAKRYVHNVISGKNADEIYSHAKTQMEDVKRQSSSRLSGYIGPEQYEQFKLSQQSLNSSQPQMLRCKFSGSVQNIFASDNSVDSFSINQFSQTSQCSFLEHISQDNFHAQNSNSSAKSSNSKQLSIQPNPSLQNSSSKSNLCGLALRENVDGELRRSAQKNFTGKDQRNVSPFTGSNTGSGRKVQSLLVNELSANSAKAKRQILFDS